MNRENAAEGGKCLLLAHLFDALEKSFATMSPGQQELFFMFILRHAPQACARMADFYLELWQEPNKDEWNEKTLEYIERDMTQTIRVSKQEWTRVVDYINDKCVQQEMNNHENK